MLWSDVRFASLEVFASRVCAASECMFDCHHERAREHQRLLQNESFTAAKPRRHDLPPQGAGIGRPSSAQTHKVIIRRTDRP